MFRHHAALALSKLTRVTSGVNLPPLEVIMSRTLPQALYKASCQQGKGCSTSHLPAC
jgi:hypothetical protein